MLENLEENKPKLFNKATIVAFSILLSTFFSGILYAQNLSATGNRRHISSVIIFCIVWNLLAFNILRRITDNSLLMFLIPNIIGGLILAVPIWNYQIKDLGVYKTRKIWGPLIVVLTIYGLLIVLNIMKAKN